jgi:hypothetical protein
MGVAAVSQEHRVRCMITSSSSIVDQRQIERSRRTVVLMTSALPALLDEDAADPVSTRGDLLGDSLREYTPVRHIFVQKPPAAGKGARGEQRGSILGELVESHQERALDAILFLIAIEPVLKDEPLPAAAWARALSTSKIEVPESSMTRVWRQLKERNLVNVERRQRRSYVLPNLEDGSGKDYTRPGAGNDSTKGWPREDYYLTLPHAYWTGGYFERLTLTGKAMLLIALQNTGTKAEFYLPYAMAPDWYGISADSAEKGIGELRRIGLLAERPQRKRSARAPDGFTIRWHYSLTAPFSTANRDALRAKAKAERAKKAKTSTTGTGADSS